MRIIAATNRDIQEQISKGNFRADLLYRLDTCHISIPPLRERKNDILPLARHFLKIHAAQNEKEIDSLASDLAQRFLEYPFPGNVRELENIVAAAVLLEKGKILTLASAHGLDGFPGLAQRHNAELPALAELEKRHIHRALEVTGGNRTRAAKILGIGLRTLQRKLKGFGKPLAVSQ